MKKINNPLIFELENLGVISRARLDVYYPRVRDRKDVYVLRDTLTEVIVINSSDHVSKDYYAARKEKKGIKVHGSEIITPKLDDNIRRVTDFGRYIRNKRWIDFGCGTGGMLDEIASEASWSAGLEPNKDRAQIVKSKGYNLLSSLDELGDESIDVITLFHVLEHLTNPVDVLKDFFRVLRPGGYIIVEVPHARDALFSLFDCEAFKIFTFWSEHLVLHTRQSLLALLKSGGFNSIEIIGLQRYNLANHLYWLSKGLPGGGNEWSFLQDVNLDANYASNLVKIDRQDTLVALIKK